MDIWDNGLGICSSSCSTAESLGEAAEAQRVSFGSPALCRVALLGEAGMVRVAGKAPRRVPSSPLEAVLVAGSPSELLARAAFPAHLEAIWSWAQAGAGAWFNGIEMEGCQ